MWVAEAARLPAETGMNELRWTPKDKSNGLCQLLKGRAQQRLEATSYLFGSSTIWYGNFLI